MMPVCLPLQQHGKDTATILPCQNRHLQLHVNVQRIKTSQQEHFRFEAIAIGVEEIASRLEAIPIRYQALGYN